MKINEAINVLEIDAINLVGRLASEPVPNTQFSELWKRKLNAIDLAQTALREKQERERNEPLTLEEMLTLQGQPVWIDRIAEHSVCDTGWAVVEYSKEFEEWRVWWPGSEVEDTPNEKKYGETWVAYRNKPVADTNVGNKSLANEMDNMSGSFLKEFLNQLNLVFKDNIKTREELLECAGTAGWRQALIAAANKAGMGCIVPFYESLDWKDSDDVDACLIGLMVNHEGSLKSTDGLPEQTKARLIDADELIAYIKDLPTWWADAGGTYEPPMKYPDGMFDVNDVINSIESMVDERAGDKD